MMISRRVYDKKPYNKLNLQYKRDSTIEEH